MECPARLCTYNIASFLRSCQVNRDMESVILSLQQQVLAAKEKEAKEALENGEDENGEGGEVDEGGEGPSTAASGPDGHQILGDVKMEKENNAGNNAVTTSTAIPEAWVRTMNLDKQREQDRVKQLYTDFKEFDADLIEALLEQEEGDDKSVRIALQRMQDDMQKFNQPKTGVESTPGKTTSRKTPRKSSTPVSTIDLCSPSDSIRSSRKRGRVGVGASQ